MKPCILLPFGAVLAAAAATASADPIPGLGEGPVDVVASVVWSDQTGATLHSETQHVTGQAAGPSQSAEILFVQSLLGANASGHAPNVHSAFASSVGIVDGAQQDGGVGVSALKFSPASVAGGFDQLVSQVSWQQTFDNAGPNAVTGSLHLVIPELSVGLFGVPPQRSAVNAIETALAEVQLTASIRHADGSIDPAAGLDLGMHIDEFQLFLAPGHLENFADVTFIGNVGNAFTFDGDEFDRLATLAPGSRNVSIGTLQPGDSYTYTYQLTVRGRTAGAERGFQAFVGDPFSATFTADGLEPTFSLAAVPEPGTDALLLAGLGALAAVLRRRARPAR
jgi:hypothetical protein